jgi:hypothetical protein
LWNVPRLSSKVFLISWASSRRRTAVGVTVSAAARQAQNDERGAFSCRHIQAIAKLAFRRGECHRVDDGMSGGA